MKKQQNDFLNGRHPSVSLRFAARCLPAPAGGDVRRGSTVVGNLRHGGYLRRLDRQPGHAVGQFAVGSDDWRDQPARAEDRRGKPDEAGSVARPAIRLFVCVARPTVLLVTRPAPCRLLQAPEEVCASVGTPVQSSSAAIPRRRRFQMPLTPWLPSRVVNIFWRSVAAVFHWRRGWRSAGKQRCLRRAISSAWSCRS